MTHVREQPECLVPKHPSDTRWSARAYASEAFYRVFTSFKVLSRRSPWTLFRIAAHEMKQMNWPNTWRPIALMCELWNDILQCFNSSSKLLQSNTMELTPATGVLKSLDKFLEECRGKFDYYEQQAGDRCGSSTYKSEGQRVPKRKSYLSDGDARDAVEGMPSQQRFKVNAFYVIIDQLKSALEKRIEAYSLVLQIVRVLTKYESMSDEDIDVAMLSQDVPR